MAFTRRNFLFGSGAALGYAVAGGIGGVALLEGTAHAGLAYTGYRAAVCVLLLGGNDSNNMLIPLTGAAWTNYKANRPVTAAGLGIYNDPATVPQDVLLNPVNGVAGSYALHPKMPGLAGLFNAGQAAFVANVGTLMDKLSNVTDYGNAAKRKPDYLFSHQNQQNAWEAGMGTQPATMSSGWGGRLADKLTVNNTLSGGYAEVTSLTGTRLFSQGEITDPIAIAAGAAYGRNSTGSNTTATTTAMNSWVNTVRDGAAAGILGQNVNAIADAYGYQYDISIANSLLRASAAASNPLPTPVDNLFLYDALGTNGKNTNPAIQSGLAGQLRQILKEMVLGAAVGGGGIQMKRQLFIASQGGYDTHTDQLNQHNTLYAQLDAALTAFDAAIQMLNTTYVGGIKPYVPATGLQVTTFTMSDFGRTFEPNSNGGTDHGWGSHMIVLGDSVVGGKVYGPFPDLAVGGTLDVGEGRWIPQNSADQYTYTIAKWMGLTAPGTAGDEQSYVFPNRNAFLKAGATYMDDLKFLTA